MKIQRTHTSPCGMRAKCAPAVGRSVRRSTVDGFIYAARLHQIFQDNPTHSPARPVARRNSVVVYPRKKLPHYNRLNHADTLSNPQSDIAGHTNKSLRAVQKNSNSAAVVASTPWMPVGRQWFYVLQVSKSLPTIHRRDWVWHRLRFGKMGSAWSRKQATIDASFKAAPLNVASWDLQHVKILHDKFRVGNRHTRKGAPFI